MRIFLDANILFSAAYNPNSIPARFFQLASLNVCQLVSSAYAIDEASRNIARKKPDQSAALNACIASLEICREASADILQWALTKGLPFKDAPILAAAVHGRAQWLVTGDRADFGVLFGQTLAGVSVLPPREALERLLEAAGG